MTRQIRTLLHMFAAIVFLVVAAWVLQPAASNTAGSVTMLDVGQGDSFLIQSASGTQLLIDAGRDSSVLTELSRIMPTGDTTIDAVIATHPDADHIGGLPAVFDRYDVGVFLTAQSLADTQLFRDVHRSILEHEIPAYYLRRGMILALDERTSFTVLFPDRDTSQWETNTASVVGKLRMGERSMLLTGDSPVSIERFLVKAVPGDVDVDILKLGHHGSKTSSSVEFLRAASPALALISAGANNRYGHPAPQVTDLLAQMNIPSLSTIDKGTVTVSTDGTKWVVSYP